MVVAGFGGSVGTGGFIVGGSGKKTCTHAFATHVKQHNLPSSSIMVTTATPGIIPFTAGAFTTDRTTLNFSSSSFNLSLVIGMDTHFFRMFLEDRGNCTSSIFFL